MDLSLRVVVFCSSSFVVKRIAVDRQVAFFSVQNYQVYGSGITFGAAFGTVAWGHSRE